MKHVSCWTYLDVKPVFCTMPPLGFLMIDKRPPIEGRLPIEDRLPKEDRPETRQSIYMYLYFQYETQILMK